MLTLWRQRRRSQGTEITERVRGELTEMILGWQLRRTAWKEALIEHLLDLACAILNGNSIEVDPQLGFGDEHLPCCTGIYQSE